MSPGIGTLSVFPSIWGRKYFTVTVFLSLLTLVADWAGGPGDSKDDVRWLDEQLSRFFREK